MLSRAMPLAHWTLALLYETFFDRPAVRGWQLFSSRQAQIQHGARHYRPRRVGAWDLLYYLYLIHVLEEPGMAEPSKTSCAKFASRSCTALGCFHAN